MRLQNGRLIEGWPVAIQTFQNGDLYQIKQISESSNILKERCKRLIKLIRKFYSSSIILQFDRFPGTLTGTLSSTAHYLPAGICFEACKMQQVWPIFMSQTILQSRNLKNYNKQHCKGNFTKLKRFLPDEHLPPIHHMVRHSHRYLANWGCCTRLTCPLLVNVIFPKSQQTT